MITIYIITNMTTGLVYVGQTCNTPEARLKQHISMRKCTSGCRRLYEALRNYGPNAFVTQALTLHDTKEQAAEAEKAMIVLFNSRHPDYGYNIAAGGPHPSGFLWSDASLTVKSQNMMGNKRGAGHIPSPEKRHKIRESLTGHPVSDATKQKIRESMAASPKCRGHSMSPEVRAKISQARKGKTHSAETIDKMRAAKVGYVPWNKGVPMTQEQKEKLSCAHRGKALSDAHKAKISIAVKAARA